VAASGLTRGVNDRRFEVVAFGLPEPVVFRRLILFLVNGPGVNATTSNRRSFTPLGRVNCAGVCTLRAPSRFETHSSSFGVKRSTGHTHTHRQRTTPPTHTHDKNNTSNPQTNTSHKHLTTLEGGAATVRERRCECHDLESTIVYPSCGVNCAGVNTLRAPPRFETLRVE